MIIRGGENIYPKEIEDYILQHEAVEDVHVCVVTTQIDSSLTGGLFVSDCRCS